MHKPSTLKDYLVASLIAVVLIALFIVYLEARRGYVNLYIFNKVFASAGAMMIGIVFLTGPIVRHFKDSSWCLQYRKEIGIVGGILVVAHGFISLFLMPDRFPLVGYLDRLNTFIPGLTGVLVLIFLIFISRQKIILKWGGGVWWKFQRWGLRIVVLATLVHVIWMKFPGWKSWFVKGGSADLALPGLPPASLLAMAFFCWVVLVRVYEYFALYPSHHVSVHNMPSQIIQGQPAERVDGIKWFITGSGFLLLVFYMFSFWWGSKTVY